MNPQNHHICEVLPTNILKLHNAFVGNKFLKIDGIKKMTPLFGSYHYRIF